MALSPQTLAASLGSVLSNLTLLASRSQLNTNITPTPSPLEDLDVSIWLQNGHTEIQASVLQEHSGISGEVFAGRNRSVERGQNERVIQYLLHGVVQNLGC